MSPASSLNLFKVTDVTVSQKNTWETKTATQAALAKRLFLLWRCLVVVHTGTKVGNTFTTSQLWEPVGPATAEAEAAAAATHTRYFTSSMLNNPSKKSRGSHLAPLDMSLPESIGRKFIR